MNTVGDMGDWNNIKTKPEIGSYKQVAVPNGTEDQVLTYWADKTYLNGCRRDYKKLVHVLTELQRSDFDNLGNEETLYLYDLLYWVGRNYNNYIHYTEKTPYGLEIYQTIEKIVVIARDLMKRGIPESLKDEVKYFREMLSQFRLRFFEDPYELEFPSLEEEGLLIPQYEPIIVETEL
jgi:hypothetical protein